MKHPMQLQSDTTARTPIETILRGEVANQLIKRLKSDLAELTAQRNRLESIEFCQWLASELQLLSIEMLKGRNGMKYEEWMHKAIPIEQELYAKAIQAAIKGEKL